MIIHDNRKAEITQFKNLGGGDVFYLDTFFLKLDKSYESGNAVRLEDGKLISFYPQQHVQMRELSGIVAS